jgi:hypothetical protein
MKMLFIFCLLLSGLAVELEAQNVDVLNGLSIDPSRPYVYLTFDHIGEGTPVSDKEPVTRIWLRLTDNSRLPIVVSGRRNAVGGLKDEAFVNNIIVPEKLPCEVGMPEGYLAGDVDYSITLMPRESVLVSFPINFITKDWHIEIGFNFVSKDSPKGLVPEFGGYVKMALVYRLWDLPQKQQVEIQRMNRDLKSR